MAQLVYQLAEIRIEDSLTLSFEVKSAPNQMRFFLPVKRREDLLGWLEFEYVLTIHGKAIFEARGLHQAGVLDPAALNICQLLSLPPLKGCPDAT